MIICQAPSFHILVYSQICFEYYVVVSGLSVSMSQKGQAGVYDSINEKDNTRSPVRLERDLYPTHTRAQLKDEETKVDDAEDQYD